MRSSLSLIFVLLAACGGGGGNTTTTTPTPDPQPQPQPDPEPVAAGPTCDDAAAKVVELVVMDEQLTTDQSTRLKAAMLDACTGGPWPDEAIRCVAEATAESIEACESTLPEEMAQQVGDAVRAILQERDDSAVKPPA